MNKWRSAMENYQLIVGFILKHQFYDKYQDQVITRNVDICFYNELGLRKRFVAMT
jgi:hypothetical protein